MLLYFTKRLALIFCIALYFANSNKVMAQSSYQLPPNQPEQDACHALQLCGSSFFTPYSYIGNGKVLDLDSTPCFPQSGGGEKNSVWLQVQIATAGSIVFTIKPISPSDDYNFAVLNATGKSCGSLTMTDVIRCNFSGNISGTNPTGSTGTSDTSRTPYIKNNTFGIPFCQSVFARGGETYLIMVNGSGNNTNGSASKGFTIDFSGSTAIFYNTANPQLQSVDETCNDNTSVIVKLSTEVLCSSIASDGSDFITNAPAKVISASGVNCNNAGGYTNSVAIHFSSPLPPGNYTIGAQTGTDNNTLIGLCNSQLLLPNNAIPFVMQSSGKAVIDDEFICYQQLPYVWNGKQITTGGDGVASYIAPSAAGCDSTTILNLHVTQAPQQVNVSSVICDGNSYVLPWDSTVNTPGYYQHHYINANGCDSLIQTVTLTVFTPPNGNVATRDSTYQTGFCENGSILLNAGNNFTSYLWNTGQTTPSIIVNVAGAYSLIAQDIYGCTSIDTFAVAAYQLPSADFRHVEYLCPDSLKLLDGGSGYASYLWNDGSTVQTYITHTPGTFWVRLTDKRNCTATDSVSVVMVQPPSGFLDKSVTKCANKITTLSPLSNYDTYNWSNGSKTRSVTIPAGGLYWLKVTDDNGCAGRDSITVIDSLCPIFFSIPTAFTPNHDGHNDIFKPGFSGTLVHYHFAIYNRWGKLVFSSNDSSQGWDGTLKGNPQSMDTYLWICSFSLDGKPATTEKGTVTLIR